MSRCSNVLTVERLERVGFKCTTEPVGSEQDGPTGRKTTCTQSYFDDGVVNYVTYEETTQTKNVCGCCSVDVSRALKWNGKVEMGNRPWNVKVSGWPDGSLHLLFIDLPPMGKTDNPNVCRSSYPPPFDCFFSGGMKTLLLGELGILYELDGPLESGMRVVWNQDEILGPIKKAYERALDLAGLDPRILVLGAEANHRCLKAEEKLNDLRLQYGCCEGKSGLNAQYRY